MQGFKQHQQCDVLLEPGGADVTADVDFKALTQAALPQGMHMCIVWVWSYWSNFELSATLQVQECLAQSHKMNFCTNLESDSVWRYVLILL